MVIVYDRIRMRVAVQGCDVRWDFLWRPPRWIQRCVPTVLDMIASWSEFWRRCDGSGRRGRSDGSDREGVAGDSEPAVTERKTTPARAASTGRKPRRGQRAKTPAGACVRAPVRPCARATVRPCARVPVRARAHVRTCARAYVRPCVAYVAYVRTHVRSSVRMRVRVWERVNYDTLKLFWTDQACPTNYAPPTLQCQRGVTIWIPRCPYTVPTIHYNNYNSNNYNNNSCARTISVHNIIIVA